MGRDRANGAPPIQAAQPANVLDPPRSAAPNEKELESLWLALGDENVKQAYDALERLVQAGDKGVPFLAAKLTSSLEEGPVRNLIARLDNSAFWEREAASQELERMGAAAAAAVRQALETKPSLEVRVRLERLLIIWEEGPMFGSDSAQHRRVLRSIQALERVGTPRARGVLETMASGYRSARWVKEQAAESLCFLRRLYSQTH